MLVTKHKVAQDKIAALTPYSAQKEEIKKYLRGRDLSRIQVKTVTESQGNSSIHIYQSHAAVHNIVCF